MNGTSSSLCTLHLRVSLECALRRRRAAWSCFSTCSENVAFSRGAQASTLHVAMFRGADLPPALHSAPLHSPLPSSPCPSDAGRLWPPGLSAFGFILSRVPPGPSPGPSAQKLLRGRKLGRRGAHVVCVSSLKDHGPFQCLETHRFIHFDCFCFWVGRKI